MFTPQDIAIKIDSLLNLRPTDTKEVEKWTRIQRNYTLVSYQGTHILYRNEKGNTAAKRVIDLEEIFKTLDQFHQIEGKHFSRTKLHKSVAQLYFGITGEICCLYISTCKTCHLE